MKALAAILEEEVAGGAAPEVRFGRAKEEAPPARMLDSERLIARLDRQAQFNNRLVVTIVASYLVILATATTLAVVHHEDTNWIAAALGGNVLVLLGSIGFVRDLWREKNYIDMLLAILPSLTTEEATKMLRSFYFDKVAAKSRPQRAAAPA